MVTGSLVPVIAGLAAGIALVVLFAVALKPDSMMSDDEIISKYSKIPEVRYFLDKYPDAKADVDRNPFEEFLTISFTVEKQIDQPAGWYTGTHNLGVNIYTKPNHVSLAIFCGMGGMTGEEGLSGINTIDAVEQEYFRAGDEIGVFAPDTTGDELGGGNFGAEDKIELTIDGLRNTYRTGEHIIFSVSAKGVSTIACNIVSPSVDIRDDSDGKMLYWPHPFGFSYAMGCPKMQIDNVWTFGDNVDEEIVSENSGSYTVLASIEGATVEKQFTVTN